MQEAIQVLLVEDDKHFQRLAQIYLEKDAGNIIKIESVSSSIEAFQALEIGDYDVIVSDYLMTPMTGLELLENLRKRGDLTPFILLTGFSKEKIAIEALNLGVDFYIQKTGQPDFVFAELKHFILTSAEKRRERIFRRKLQAEIIEKDKLAIIGQLAAGVAHQLNTPLANIGLTITYILKLLERQQGIISERVLNDELDDIQNQVRFCSQIVKSLLQYSRNIDIMQTNFDLRTLMMKITESHGITSILQKKDIQLSFDVPEGINVFGDQNLLLQVFQNILNNSIDALEEKEDGKISISIENDKREVMVIKISDNGMGISPKNQLQIFEPFFTTKRVGQGTGLGLAICKGIIEKHKGTIQVISRGTDQGTELTVNLPKKASLIKEERKKASL